MKEPQEGKTGRSSRTRLTLLALLAFVVFLVGIVSLFFLLFNSPAAVNRLAAMLEPVTGYAIHVGDISLSPGFKGDVSNLMITKQGESSPFASFAHVEFKASPGFASTATVERLVLRNPKLRFVLKPDKEETDWAGLDKLPPVKLLRIEGGEVDVSDGTYRLKAVDLDVTVNDFSPRTGGRGRLTSALTISSVTSQDGIKGKGSVSADIRLTGFSPNLVGKGVFSVKIDSAALSGLSFKNVVLDAPLSFDPEKLVFDGTNLRIASLEYGANGNPGMISNLEISGSGTFDRRSSRLTLRQIGGNLSDAGKFTGNGSATLSGNYPWTASLSARSIDFASVFALMNPILPEDYRKWGIRGKGDLEADLEGRFSDQNEFRGTLKVSMRDAGFASPDQSKAGAGLTGEIILRLHPPGSGRRDFTGRVEMKGGEFLWGSYYNDLAGESLAISSKGQFSVGAETFLDCAGDLDLYQTGKYWYRASLGKNHMAVSATGKDLSHDRLHDLFLRDFLGDDSALSGMKLSGLSDVEVTMSRSGDRTSLHGRLTMADASVDLPKQQLAVEDLDVDLPFDLAYPYPESKGKGNRETGSIRMKRFQRAGIRIENLEVPLAAARNRFETLKAIEIPLFGGMLRVDPVVVQDLLTPSAEVSTRIKAEDIDLALLTDEFAGVPVKGVINANLGETSLRKGIWSSSGGVRVNVFGGEVQAGNLSASDLLKPSRTVSGDVHFGNIDLEQVTSQIETGKVTGLIKGSITDFTMTYGEPSSFVLVLESDTSKRVRRMISVDAIENLSIIGTGSSGISAVLNTGINRFFKAYPYSRIGIRCTLRNDTFRLRGTIREGNTEYLVRKGWLRGIDVINQNPDNAISFRDMQERIGRIFKSDKAEVS